MKTQLHHLTTAVRALLLLAGLLLLPAALRAATATPPDRISYQGFLVDANGVPLGSNAPVNHTLEFRIYNVSSGGSSIWDEQQVVTIDKGYFSVLLGDGTGTTHPSLSTLFAGADAGDRYVSVKNLSLAGSTEMLPRLRLVTSPYAMMAGSLPAGSITNGLFAAASITGNKLATNTLTAANFSTNVGLWTANGTNIYRTNGNVGIGTATPNFPLSFPDSNGEKISLWGQDRTVIHGLGVGGARMEFYVPQTTHAFDFGVGNHTNLAVKMRIQGNGNVGIGTATTASTLDVFGSGSSGGFVSPARALRVRSTASFGAAIGVDASTVAGGKEWDFFSTGGNAAEGQGKLILRNDTDNVNAMTITPNGFVGIGTSTPGGPLEIAANLVSPMLALKQTLPSWASGPTFDAFRYISTSFVPGDGNPKVFNVGAGGVSIGYANVPTYGSSHALYVNGNVGIGTTTPGALLHIRGGNNRDQGLRLENIANGNFWNMHIDNNGQALVFSYNNQWPGVNYAYLLPNSAGLISASDRRVKKDIQDMAPCLDRVLALKPSTFRYQSAEAGSPMNYGFIAQDVEQQFPDLVLERDGLKTLVAAGLTAINTRAIQELARQVKAQETELTELRAELAKLRTEKKSLASTVSELKAQDEARESRLARLEKALDSRTAVIEAKATSRDVIGASK